ncbi:hypothetical protein BDN70DRAFT_901434 [Pholiota conissans]|uniref:MER3 helicase-like winged helix domain-containing protein n=1 Tax=Pholiota conissans TaxID=109636 RepID=A0A9P5YK60_9AGAR|nr:hypothetical protein BDN70DRAFT_901434 [Pholiota conissans]
MYQLVGQLPGLHGCVGLSATLENYQDVGTFLRVDEEKGLFYYYGEEGYQAVPGYEQGCYEKMFDQAGKNQRLIFVHLRKETAKIARFLRDMAIKKETITQFVKPDGTVREILTEEANSVKDSNLRDLLPFGFAIYHAGMSRDNCGIVEELFADGSIQVLVCTAMLAWGSIFLRIYNSEKGRWVELSSQDVLQFVSKLADNLNAGIILGTVQNRDETVQWLGYTYLYVRMLKSPALYGVGADYWGDDKGLIQKLVDSPLRRGVAEEVPAH